MANTIQKESKIIYLQIGQNYENLGVQKQFDVSEWTAEFPDAHIYLLFKRPGEEAAAPVNTALDEDGILTWTVSNWETGIIGIGFAEIRAIDSSTGLVKKSHVIPCSIEASVTDEDEAPDYPSWVDRMLRFGENVDSIYATLPHELEEGIASIQQEAQAQTEAIEQKGITTRASIPADYTALSDEVTDIKSALVQVAFFDGYIEDFGFRNIIRSNDDNTMEYANSQRLSSNLFNYINPKITLSLTGAGWLATILVYKDKRLVFGSGWRTEYTYKATDCDSFAILLAKQVDGAFVDIVPADASDSGLSVYVELGYIPVAKKSELDALETEVKADVDECEAKVENAENVLAYSGNITNFGLRNIIRATDDNRNEYINTARLSTLIYFYNAPNVEVSVTGEGWKFSLSFFKNHSLVFNSGWRTEYTYKAEEADSFMLTLAKQIDGAYVDIAPADANSAGLSINVIHGYVYPVSQNDFTASEKETEALQGLSKYINNTKFYGHLFIDKINDGSEVIIPCQSKWDINITARMGYKIMEGNVHKTATSGKYIVMHGSAGTIGYQLFDPNGTDISGVVIANTPFDTLRGYKYRSKYEKYQTPVTELTEFLIGCKENNMIPFVSFVDETELQIIRRYCGNNYVLYNGNRAVFGGMLTFWPTNSITIDAAKASMSYYGSPLLYGLPPVFFNNLTDAQLDDLVQYAHDRGILLGVQANHLTVQQTIRAFRHGIDASPASYQVNAFSGGNVVHISGDFTFDSITHTGSVADGKLTLQHLQGIVKEIDPIFVGKAFLRINFIGSLYIQFGRYDGAIPLESDGEQDVQMGSIIIDSSPTLRITSNETTVINSITYDVSNV